MKTTILLAAVPALFSVSALAGPLYPQMANTMPVYQPAPVYAAPQPVVSPEIYPVGQQPAYVQAPQYQVPAYPAPALPAAPAYQPAPQAYVAPQPVMAAPAAPAKAEDVWFGSAEAGLMYSTGNTERRNLNAKGELGYRPSDWEFRLGAELVNTEENDLQTDEEYRADLQGRYNFTDRDYGFVEADWIKDRFSGYDYRITEVVGYGRKWYDRDDFSWSSEAGGGMQQTKELNGDSSNNPLARLRNEFDWAITDYLSFENATKVDISELTTLRNEAALKNKLSESLFVKLGVDVEYLSDVPTGTNDTDTDVYLNLAYEY
jgi:putative salt-induced outer membrane protein